MNQKEFEARKGTRWLLHIAISGMISENRKSLNRLREQLQGDSYDYTVFREIETLRDHYDTELPKIMMHLNTFEQMHPDMKVDTESYRIAAFMLAENIRGVLMMEYLVPDPSGMYASSWMNQVEMETGKEPTPFETAVKEFNKAVVTFGNATVNYATTGAYPERAFYGDDYVLGILNDLEKDVDKKYTAVVSADPGEGERASDKVFEHWGQALDQFNSNVNKLELAFSEGRRTLFSQQDFQKEQEKVKAGAKHA